MKRVVTGHNEQGKSVFVEVAEPDHVVEAPNMTWREIWATFPDTKVPLNPITRLSISPGGRLYSLPSAAPAFASYSSIRTTARLTILL